MSGAKSRYRREYGLPLRVRGGRTHGTDTKRIWFLRRTRSLRAVGSKFGMRALPQRFRAENAVPDVASAEEVDNRGEQNLERFGTCREASTPGSHSGGKPESRGHGASACARPLDPAFAGVRKRGKGADCFASVRGNEASVLKQRLKRAICKG